MMHEETKYRFSSVAEAVSHQSLIYGLHQEDQTTTITRNERSQSLIGLTVTDLRLKGSKCLNRVSIKERKLIEEMTTHFREVYPELIGEPSAKNMTNSPLIDRAAALMSLRRGMQTQLQPDKQDHDEGKRKACDEETQADDNNDQMIEARRDKAMDQHLQTTAIGLTDKPLPSPEHRSKKRARIAFEDQDFRQPTLNVQEGISPMNQPQEKHRTPLERRLISEVKRSMMEIREMRDEWNREVQELAKREENQKSTIQTLRKEKTHLESARDERKNTGESSIKDVLYLKNEEIWKLTKRIKEMEKLAHFTRVESTSPLLCWEEVTNTMSVLSSELNLILTGHDQRKPLLIPNTIENPELAKLIRCALGNDGEEMGSERLVLRRWAAKYDPEVVIRNLILAAVKDWVFMSSFPKLNPKAAPLLEAYRESVQTHGKSYPFSPNRDLSTNIRRDMAEHTSRLLKALAPLFLPSSSEQTKENIQSWGHNDDTSEDRRFRLQGIFEAALALKARTLLSENTFEFVIHKLGTPATNLNEQAPNLSLLATVHMHPREEFGRGDQMSDALVNSNTFFDKTHPGEGSLKSCELTVQRRDLPQWSPNVWQMDIADNEALLSRQLQQEPNPKGQRKCLRYNVLFTGLQIHGINVHNEVVKPPTELGTRPHTIPKGKGESPIDSSNQINKSPGPKQPDICAKFNDLDQSGSKSSYAGDKKTRNPKIQQPKLPKEGRKVAKTLRDFKCDLCVRPFTRFQNMKNHQTRGGCRGCPHCGQPIKGRSALIEHILEKHPTASDNNRAGSSSHSSENFCGRPKDGEQQGGNGQDTAENGL
ncbi:hypothetical protein HYALB_00000371 [Hymenoscyphus albidus]|uniref:C2H2-type domain-containing protein n=1 Tax=Hymenoscyphus albidus TaxID=595503 RepID=A0A9N9Q0B4_9HELO|nr:hypothetical protein HYALB_00000371 [Hymenoscyphus albidus]